MKKVENAGQSAYPPLGTGPTEEQIEEIPAHGSGPPDGNPEAPPIPVSL